MTKPKSVLTTGQVARICNVAPRTVSKWFDAGQLRGYRIPGSKDRRIPVPELISFMKVHGIPLNGMETGRTRVLVLDGDPQTNGALRESIESHGAFEVIWARSAFEAGVAAESVKPSVMVVDVSLPDVEPAQVCRDLRHHPGMSSLKLIATGSGLTEGRSQAMLQAGFCGVLPKPFHAAQFIDTVSKALA
ncbi:MAG: response regulator [Phycisphaerales bacterium]|nr:response regulator [Phycisphaerales bacterium]